MKTKLLLLVIFLVSPCFAALAQTPKADADISPAELEEMREKLFEAQGELQILTNRIAELSTQLGHASSHDALVYLNEKKRAIIGVVIGQNKNKEVTIEGVTPGSATEEAGIKSGDRVVEVNGIKIRSGKPGVEQAINAIGKLDEGDEVDMVLIDRKGEEMRVTLAARRLAPKSWVFNFDGNKIIPPVAPVVPEMMEREMEREMKKQMQALRLGTGSAWPMARFGEKIDVTSVTEDLEPYFNTSSGALVLSVVNGSPYDKLKAGDVCKSIDGQEVKNEKHFWKLLEKHDPGEQAELEILRDGQTLTVNIEVPDSSFDAYAYRIKVDDCTDKD